MLEFNDMFKMHNIMFTAVSIFMGIAFVFVIVMMFSPKLRGKLMSHQIKSLKHMTNYSKKDIEELTSLAINTKKQILDSNEDVLREMSAKEAQIENEKLKVKLNTVRDQLLTGKTIFCKHCGQSIPTDSIYCKHCGKKQ